MRYALGLLVCGLLVLGCGGETGGGPLDSAPRRDLPQSATSVVFGEAEALTGGTLVVGHLVPMHLSHRLVDLIGEEAYARFLAEEARLAEIEALETLEEEIEEEDWAGAEKLWLARSHWRDAVAARILAATQVTVTFRDVLPTGCAGLPLVIAGPQDLEPNEIEALGEWLESGGDLARNRATVSDVGRALPGVVPASTDEDTTDVIAAACIQAIRESALVHRLPEDPLAIREARRDGDDVLVRPASRVATATFETLAGDALRAVQPSEDGWFRVPAAEETFDPFRHLVAFEWTDGDLRLRRASTIADLVGVTERRVLALDKADAGARFAAHVLFLSDRTGQPVAGRREQVRIVRGDEVLARAEGISNEAGGLDVGLAIPAETEPGSAELVVGEDRFGITIQSAVRVCVVTDRALYRPTDRVHVRVMVHEALSGRPVADREVVLKVKDVEKRVRTSTHGIASAAFRLVEAPLGRSGVLAKVGKERSYADFRVQAFERPTFLVQVEPQALRLHPGEQAPVRVQCRYVNQAPVVGATVRLLSYEDADTNVRKLMTDAEGRVEFTAQLVPDGRAGFCEVLVQDADGRREEQTISLTRRGDSEERSHLGLELIEDLVVGLDGHVALHGRPAEHLTVISPGGQREVRLDETGRGVFPVKPFEATDHLQIRREDGEETQLSFEAFHPAEGHPVVVCDRRVARLGGVLKLRVSCAPGSVTLGVARDGVLLRSQSILVGSEPRTVDVLLGDDLVGPLTLSALRVHEGRLQETRTRVLVVRGRALSVVARAVRDAYRPADVAEVDVEVLDRHGARTAAVLGYWGVDEALLSLEPWPDGREDVFDLPGEPVGLAAEAEREGAVRYVDARAALSGFETRGPESGQVRFPIQHVSSTGLERRACAAAQAYVESRVQEARATWLRAYDLVPLEDLRTAGSLHQSLSFLVARGEFDTNLLLDPWGTPLSIGHDTGWVRRTTREDGRGLVVGWSEWWGVPVLSAGPDRRFGSDDDVREAWPLPTYWDLEDGRLRRFLVFVEQELCARLADPEELAALRDRLGDLTTFFGPMRHHLIGLGGGAGGAFRGRGGRRSLWGGGGGRKAGSASPVHVRRDFEPTLCFVPEAIIGPEGRTRLEIPLRDSITTWRLRLVASAADGATGIGEGRIRVTQPLHAEPWVATRLTVGDRLELPVAIRNETDETLHAEVVATMQGGLSVRGVARLDVSVPPHGTGAAVFRMHATEPGVGSVRIDVRAGEHGDAIERIVHVRRDARDDTENWHATLQVGEAWHPEIPTASRELPREYRLRVYTSPMATVIGGLDGLLTCPHG